MIPKVFYYYIENNDVECKISTSLNDLETIILNEKVWPAFLHIAFDGPLSSSIRDDLLNAPKALFCSNGLSYSGLPSSWAFNLNKIMHISDFISYPCEIAFGQDLAKLTDDLISLNNQIKNIKPGMKVFHDYALMQWEWSVRTQNVFKENNIQLLSELVTYSDRELLLLPNFGRKSLHEINDKLYELGYSLYMNLDEYHIESAFDENNKILLHSQKEEQNDTSINDKQVQKVENKFIYDFLSSIDKLDDQRTIDILKKRAGFLAEGCQTLEQIGKFYNVTRERIRQIEAKGIKKLKHFSIGWNINQYWDNKINALLENRIYPLLIDDLKANENFKDINTKNVDTLRYIFSHFDIPIFVLHKLDCEFVTRLSPHHFLDIKNELQEFLKLCDKKPIDEIYEEGKQIFPSLASELSNKSIDFYLRNSAFGINDNQQEILVKYSSRLSAYNAAVEIFEQSDQMLDSETLTKIVQERYPYFNIRNIQNRLHDIKGVYPFYQRYWGKIKHLNLSEINLAIMKDEIKYYLDKINKDQFHGREILEVINQKKLIINDPCDEYIISAVIREYFDVPYLGRQMFANPESEIGKRQQIYDVIIQVLVKNGEPMHAKDILLEANKVRSVKGQIQEKPPIILLGKGYYALDYWDDKTKNELVSQ